MSDQLLFWIIVGSMAVAFAAGVWIGLGYPGLYDRYEDTGAGARTSSGSPVQQLLDWIFSKIA